MRKSLIAIGCLLGLSACTDVRYNKINRYYVMENNVVTIMIEGRCNGNQYPSRTIEVKCLVSSDTIKQIVISPSVNASFSSETIGDAAWGEYPFQYNRVAK